MHCNEYCFRLRDGFSSHAPKPALTPSAALLAMSQDANQQPLAQPCRQLIDLVVAVNLNGLLRRPQGDHAMLASLEVDLQIGDQASRNLVIEKITELRQKL